MAISTYDYETDSKTKELKYKFEDGFVSIRSKDATHFLDFSTEKKKDRYSFIFNKDLIYKNELETFVVTSSDKIDIIGDTLYEGWLVVPGLKKWVDFDAGGINATIKRINSKEVEITTRGEHFKSIGELNCVNKTYEFYKINYTIFYNTSAYEEQVEPFKLSINFTGLGSSDVGFGMVGYAHSDNTTKGTTAKGYIMTTAAKLSGNGGDVAGADANIFVIRNWGTARFIFDAEGSAHADVEWIAFQEHDDLALLTDFEDSMLVHQGKRGDKSDKVFKDRKVILEKKKLVKFEADDSEHAMVNFTKLHMLEVGALQQLNERLSVLEAR